MNTSDGVKAVDINERCCPEYPECTHILYWYQGFKEGLKHPTIALAAPGPAPQAALHLLGVGEPGWTPESSVKTAAAPAEAEKRKCARCLNVCETVLVDTGFAGEQEPLCGPCVSIERAAEAPASKENKSAAQRAESQTKATS